MRLQRLLLCAVTLFATPLISNASIDAEVDAMLTKRGISPSPICIDEHFVRRTFLTAAGRLPSLDEALQYRDKSREEIVDMLLASDDFTDMLTLKWGDLLKVKSEFPSNMWPNGAQAYNRWIRVHMRDNTPYDEFVEDILLSSGSNFRQPQVNFYRAFVQRSPEAIAENVELLFLGQRTTNPLSSQFFSQIRYKNTSEWKEEIVYIDLDHNPVLDTKHPAIEQQVRNTDLRRCYVEWLTSSENRQFARAMANRVWMWIMGRGVVEEADDFREDNAPSNPQLLEYLTQSFIALGYDVRALYREILLSNCYQRSSIPTSENREQGAELFAYYPTIRLTAEQIIDGISLITGVNDRYVSRVPEPYSYYPADMHSYEIGDASVSTSQLDLFGRPSRDNSLESGRNNSVNSKQTLYLLNSNSVTSKIESSNRIKEIVGGCTTREQVIDKVYIMMLCRYPTAQERSAVLSFFESYSSNQKIAQELIWALLNSAEFMFNH